MASFHLTPSRNARRTIAIATVLALLAIGAGGSPAARPTRACEEPDPPAPLVPACEADALIVLDATTAAETREAVNAIEALGGCAVHVFPPAALIAYVPPQVVMRDVPFFAEAYRGEVPAGALADLPFEAQLAAAAWNLMLTSPPPSAAADWETPPGEPLVGDAREAPASDAPQGAIASASPAPCYNQTSEFMAGKVAVGIILPESDGTIDAQTENWGTRDATVVSEIAAGLSWWAATGMPQGNLTFFYDTHLKVPTGYEPITRSSSDQGLWMAQTLAAIGYPGTSYWTQVRNYLNAIRASNGTDWAIAVFVVDSLADSDGKFTDGYFGYAYYYGPFTVMTYDNDGWGISRMDSVLAHETGHLFGAGDEYCQPGYSCCSCGGSYGYLGIANSNCEARCVTSSTDCPTCVSVNCIMRNNANVIDTPSRHQVGGRDLDSDAIPDPVDTTPTVSISTRPAETIAPNSARYTGSSQDVAYDSPTRSDVTINFISAVQYRVDAGSWVSALPADGAWDETSEDYLFATAPLALGPHTVDIRSVNRVGNSSALQTDTFVVIPAGFLPLVIR